VIRSLSLALVLAWIATAPAFAGEQQPAPAAPAAPAVPPPDTSKDQPAAPKDQPAAPVPAAPKDQPAAPKDQPAAPKDQPAAPKDQPAAPKDQPAAPVPAAPKDQPAAPKDQPAAPKDQPAAPKDQPAAPKDQPAAPKDQPAVPGTPAAPKDQPAVPKDQPAAPGTPAPQQQPTPPAPSFPPPTPEQLEAAKKAFAEGKKLHSQGKHAEAIEKFKESYRLSRNPLLLYNIGFTMDEAKEADMALYYYRKFLREAPPEAEQRPTVVERVKVLEQQFNPGGAPPEQVKAGGDAGRTRGPVVIKPPGTYNATDFEHQVIETAPPAKPLDITAVVPEDSGFVVTLFYRTAGEGKYASKVMKWRYRELVGRVPAPKMIGNAVQYYIEVKDTTGAVVTRSGKSTSPNLVNLEAGATPSFYPDLTDDGEAVLSTTEIRKRDDDDDPLNRGKKSSDDDDDLVAAPATPRGPFIDVGSRKFFYAKWATTTAAVAGVGLSLVFYIQSVNYARRLVRDSRDCPGPSPCRQYDPFAADLQTTGKRYQTMSKVALGVGAGTAAVAGVLWLLEYRAQKRGELKVSAKGAPPPAATWHLAPALGEAAGFVGATAGRSF